MVVSDEGNASRQCWTFLCWHRLVLLARLRHPPKRAQFELTQLQTSAKRAGKKNSEWQGNAETLKEMGFSDDESSRSECQNECQNVSQHPMLLMSIGSVLALLGLTHIRARRILNQELLPQFNWRIPQIAIWAKGWHSNAPHLHSEGLNRSQILPTTHPKCIRVLCHSNSLSQRLLVLHETSRSEQQNSGKTVGSSTR